MKKKITFIPVIFILLAYTGVPVLVLITFCSISAVLGKSRDPRWSPFGNHDLVSHHFALRTSKETSLDELSILEVSLS